MDALAALLTDGTGLSIWVFAGLCAISFVGSFIAAALGLGGGVLVLATMATALPPTVLIPIHGMVQLGSNLGRAILMRRDVLLKVVPAFAIGTLIGSIVGANTIIALPTWLLQAILGLFVLYATWAPKFKASDPGPVKFGLVGIFGGFATMFVGGTGPLIAPFVNAACAVRQQVVATHATLMTLQHTFKVIAFGFVGFSFGPYLPLLAGLLLFGFAGTYTGRAVLNRLPEKAFRVGLQTILTLLAIKLLWSAVMGFGSD